MPDDPKLIIPKLTKPVVEAKRESPDIVDVVDRNINRAIGVVEEGQKLAHERALHRLTIDRLILIVFAVALLATLGVMFYLIVTDRLTAVNNILYPLISLVIGFMSGYFAGSGRGGRKG